MRIRERGLPHDVFPLQRRGPDRVGPVAVVSASLTEWRTRVGFRPLTVGRFALTYDLDVSRFGYIYGYAGLEVQPLPDRRHRLHLLAQVDDSVSIEGAQALWTWTAW